MHVVSADDDLSNDARNITWILPSMNNFCLARNAI